MPGLCMGKEMLPRTAKDISFWRFLEFCYVLRGLHFASFVFMRPDFPPHLTRFITIPFYPLINSKFSSLRIPLFFSAWWWHFVLLPYFCCAITVTANLCPSHCFFTIGTRCKSHSCCTLVCRAGYKRDRIFVTFLGHLI